MHSPNRRRLSRLLALLVLPILALAAAAPAARAAADAQSFWGFGPGLEVISSSGSGTGFYIQGFGGYNFNSAAGLGLHAGYSNVGGLGLSTVDFGAFFQLTDAVSGVYGRLYVDGMSAAVSGGGSQHGVSGTQLGFAPGVGLGMLIPSAGSFHLVPELSYRGAFMQSTLNVIDITFSVMWDF